MSACERHTLTNVADVEKTRRLKEEIWLPSSFMVVVLCFWWHNFLHKPHAEINRSLRGKSKK